MLKIITILNWIVVGILALLVGLETLFPAKGGGDAAGQGMGKAIYYLAAIVLFVLLVLNLLPYALPRYIAFGLVAIPALWITVMPTIKRFGKNAWGELTAKPFFEDQERERLAMAIFDGNAAKLEKLLQNPPPRLREAEYGYPVLEIAVNSAMNFSDRKAEYLECLRMLLDAGVPLRSADPGQDAPQIRVVSIGYPDVLKILLEHGADANARGHNYSNGEANAVPMIFEAMITSYSARECVALLLKHGANPNAIKPNDGDIQRPSALMMAATIGRLDLCRMLIDHGADVRYVNPQGMSLKSILEENSEQFSPDENATEADREWLKQVANK